MHFVCNWNSFHVWDKIFSSNKLKVFSFWDLLLVIIGELMERQPMDNDNYGYRIKNILAEHHFHSLENWRFGEFFLQTLQGPTKEAYNHSFFPPLTVFVLCWNLLWATDNSFYWQILTSAKHKHCYRRQERSGYELSFQLWKKKEDPLKHQFLWE